MQRLWKIASGSVQTELFTERIVRLLVAGQSRSRDDVVDKIGHILRFEASLEAIRHDRPWLRIDPCDVDLGQNNFRTIRRFECEALLINISHAASINFSGLGEDEPRRRF